ncbi:hypothetical protein [Fusobacterium polymorphum]|jgi:hypothetical protein|uniref:hypothetical protein n=1 Tax=Fusobacterium nucleatum subsp. polymorphum TaxID=76857 RepID=UPI003009117B
MSDEDKMIKKLQEHRDLKKMIVEIGKICGIPVTETEGNDSRGDFSYPSEKREEFIKAIDEYIGDHKYIKKGE